jgi:hypothetical protein
LLCSRAKGYAAQAGENANAAVAEALYRQSVDATDLRKRPMIAGLGRTGCRMGPVEAVVMNANDFLMSLTVVSLAALGGYGQEVRAEPAEIATAVEQPVEQPMEASGEASEQIRDAKKAAGDLIDDGGELIDDTVITTIGEMMERGLAKGLRRAMRRRPQSPSPTAASGEEFCSVSYNRYPRRCSVFLVLPGPRPISLGPSGTSGAVRSGRDGGDWDPRVMTTGRCV